MRVKEFWASVIGGALGSGSWAGSHPHAPFWQPVGMGLLCGAAGVCLVHMYYRAKRRDDEEARK